MFSTITTTEKEQIIHLYNSGIGATTIARQINRSEIFVKYNLKKNGIAIRKTSDGLYRRSTLTTNYFDTVDTDEKAYWLGFLYADGYNMEQRGEVKLCLGKLDIEHIKAFQLAINSNQEIKEYAGNKRDNTCQITICNKHFSEKLAELGCFQAKSLCLKFPTLSQVPTQHISSFMLGYFDGDGCIYKSTNTEFSITSSYDFCTSYQQVLMEKCNLNKTAFWAKKDGRALREHAWAMRYSGRNSITRIYNYLYSSSTPCYLLRKWNKFKEIINEQ